MQPLPQACQPGSSDSVLRAMFEARKRVFVDLLGWDVPVLAGAFEVDQFDTPDAAYLVLADGASRHRASARLLRTDRPHILGSLFACLCNGPVPHGPDIREITRFCIEPRLPRAERREARNQLVTALVDHALATGVTRYTAVANTSWFRQIADFGWQCRALDEPCSVGGETLVALQIDIDRATPAALARGGVYCPASYRLAGAHEELVS